MAAMPTGVEIHNNKIRISFKFQGVRCRETLKGWIVNASNLKKAGNLRAKIVSEIQLGTFDYRGVFPESKVAAKFYASKNITTFAELASTWHENHKIDLSPNATRSYGIAVRTLTKLIGPETLVASITNSDILGWRKELLTGETNYAPEKRRNKTGRAVRTVDYYLAILRQILDYAVKNKVISYQPYVGIKRLRKGQTKPDPLLRHEFEQLKETAPAQQKNMWQFFAYTGVRPGELCALAWEDIDLNSGEATIARNLTQEGLFGPPKTEAGYRTIKLLEPALEALRAQKELTGSAPKVPVTFHHREFGKTETQKLHFVFMPRPLKGKQAAYYSVSSIVSLWDITVRRSGIRRRRPYQLRHTYACWMLSAGANPAFIANQMGHENAEMVFHVYSAWINALDSDQVSFLNQRFGGYANAPIVSLKLKTK